MVDIVARIIIKRRVTGPSSKNGAKEDNIHKRVNPVLNGTYGRPNRPKRIGEEGQYIIRSNKELKIFFRKKIF